MPVVKVERMPEKLPVKKPSSSNSSSSNNNTNNNNNNSNNNNPTNTNQGNAKASITNGTLKDAGPSASPITAQAVASTATTTPSSDGPAPNSMPGTMAFPNCCNKIACHKPQKKEKLLPCKDREFDANKHCGVKVTVDSKPCTRSLTCKTHALSLRRAVAGRRKPFDELLKDHRAAKEAIQKEKVHAQNMAAAQRVAAQTAAATTALAAHALSGSCSANNSSGTSSNATPSTNTTTTNSGSGAGSGLNAGSGVATATSGTQGLISSRGGGGPTNSSSGHGAGGGGGGGAGGGGGSLSSGGAITSQTSITKHSTAETTNGKDSAALQHGSNSNRWSVSGIKPTKNTKPNLLPESSHHLHPSTAGHVREENLSSSAPECCTRLSSEEEGDEAHSSKSGSIYLSHHPRPAAMCTFGGRFLKNGVCFFNRKSDLVQSSLYNVLEKLTHPPPHKKLCVESNLPKEPQLVTNSKDPYEFNMVDTTSGSSHSSNSVINSTNKGAVKPKSKSSASKSSKPKDSGTKSPGLLSSAAGSNVAKRKRSSSIVQQVGHTLAATSNPSCSNVANNVMNMLYSHNNALAFTYPNVNLSSTTLNHFNANLPTRKQPSSYKELGFVVTGFDNRNYLVNGQYVNNACMPDTVMAQLPTQEERCSSSGGSGSVKRSHNGSVKSSCAGSKTTSVLDSSSSSSSQSVSSNSLFASVPRNTTMYMDAGSVLASVTLGATSNSTVVSLSNSAQSPTQPSPSATPSPHHRSGSVSPQVTVSSPLPNGIVPSPSEKGSSNHRHTVQGSVQRAHKSSGALQSSQAINVHSNSKARHSSSLSSSSANSTAKLQHQSSGSAAGAGSGGSSGDGGSGGGRGSSSSSSPKLSSTTASTSASAATLTTAATGSSGKGGHQHHHQTLAHMHIKSAAGSAAASVGGSNAITKTLGGRLNVPSLQVTFPLSRQVMATSSQPQTVFAMRPTDDRQRQDLTSAVQPQGHGGSSSSMIS